MTDETTAPLAVAERPLRGWLSPQVLLGIAGLLTFALIPVHFNTVYEGLPAHPLFVHVPVILIPTVGVGALIVSARARWFERHSVWLCAVAVVALGALNLTMGAATRCARTSGSTAASADPWRA